MRRLHAIAARASSRRSDRRGGRGRDERGASLVMVLVFITALSIIIDALLSGGATSQKTTVVAADLADATHATDSGVEHGLEQLRTGNGFCPAVGGPLKVTDGTTAAGSTTVGSLSAGFVDTDVGLEISGGSLPLGTIISSRTSATEVQVSKPAITDQTGVTLTVARPAGMLLPKDFAPGQPLTVTCSGAEADYAPQSITSWAVVTLSPGSNSLRTQAGGGGNKQISGPTYVGGKFNLQAPLRVNDVAPLTTDPGYPVGDGVGLVYQSTAAAGGCARPSLTDLIATFACSPMQPPDPKPPLPPPSSFPSAGGYVDIGGCRIFRPGKYTTAAQFNLAAVNYLASGVYYLENLGLIDMDGPGAPKKVFGGKIDTSSGEERVLANAPCGTDAQAGVTTGDTGVHIILGGTSRLDIDEAEAEFMAYHPAAGSEQAGAGISIRTVSEPTSGYTLWNGPGVGLKVEGGTNPHFAVHGLVYMPDASIELFATNTSQAALLGGVVAWDLLLQASAVGGGLLVQVAGDRPRSRSAVIIEGTVPVSSTKTVKSRAVVDVQVSRTVTDGVTDGSNLVTSATAQFSEADVGLTITGTGIPPGSTITSFVSTSAVEISSTVASGTGRTLNIDPPLVRTVTVGLTAASKEVTSATSEFSGADVRGTITGPGIPPGTTIDTLVNAGKVLISNNATSGGATVNLTITRRKIVRVAVRSWRVENL